jgi:hypothetical protein
VKSISFNSSSIGLGGGVAAALGTGLTTGSATTGDGRAAAASIAAGIGRFDLASDLPNEGRVSELIATSLVSPISADGADGSLAAVVFGRTGRRSSGNNNTAPTANTISAMAIQTTGFDNQSMPVS